MKYFALILLFVAGSVFTTFAQDEKPVFTFGKVVYYDLVPGMGEGKVKRMSATIEAYFNSIISEDQKAWEGCMSDSTMTRVASMKLPKKFDRLKKYGITDGQFEVVDVKVLNKAYENEVGTEYQVVIEFEKPLIMEERVSFDALKWKNKNDNVSRIAINLVNSGKEYKICLHKHKQGNKK
jgi:hypothetical protein